MEQTLHVCPGCRVEWVCRVRQCPFPEAEECPPRVALEALRDHEGVALPADWLEDVLGTFARVARGDGDEIPESARARLRTYLATHPGWRIRLIRFGYGAG